MDIKSKVSLHAVIDNRLVKFIEYDGGKIPSAQNCELCSKPIKQVVVLLELKSNSLRQIDIGCAENVTGLSYNDFSMAVGEHTNLLQVQLQSDRQKRYSKIYGDKIKLLKSVQDDVIGGSRFLTKILEVLTTGCEIFTKDMQNGLESFLNAPRREEKKYLPYDANDLRNLLELIAKVDRKKISNRTTSAYIFVNSVLWFCTEKSGITPAQLGAIEKIWKKYRAKEA
jgi:hypothetical protein